MLPPPRSPSAQKRDVSISSGTKASEQADHKGKVTAVSPLDLEGARTSATLLRNHRPIPLLKRPLRNLTPNQPPKTCIRTEKETKHKPRPILGNREPSDRLGEYQGIGSGPEATAILPSWTTLPANNPSLRNVACAHRLVPQIPRLNRAIAANPPKKISTLSQQMVKSLGRLHRFEHFKNAHFAQAARLFAQVGFAS